MSALPYDKALSDEVPEASMLRVVRGAADDDEIAALVTAIVAVSAGPTPVAARIPVAPPAVSAWARSGRPGAPPAGWRAAGHPVRRRG